MKVTTPETSYADGRGEITDLLLEPIGLVTRITSVAGTVRGHHYHKESVEYIYLLSGRLRATAKIGEGPVESCILEPGQMLSNTPMEAHALEAIEDSVFLSLTRGPKHRHDTFPMRVE